MEEELLKNYESLMLSENAADSSIYKSEDAILRFRKIDEANQIFFELNQKGTQLEKEDNVNEAIKIYEKIINYSADIPHPYSRLAIIYRKQKRYADEVRVLKKAIYVYENVVFHKRGDRINKLNKFKERLEKAQELFDKNK